MVNGQAVFPDLQFAVAGSYSLRATFFSQEAAPGESATFVISPPNAVASSLQFLQQPALSTPAGTPIAPAVSVQVLDQFGNRMGSATNPVELTVAGVPVLGGGPVAATGGLADFPALTVNQPGTYTLTATSPGLAPVPSQQFTITAAAGGLFAFVSQATTTNLAGFSRDPATGVLAPVGTTNVAGLAPFLLRRTPDGRFLYLLHAGAGNILERFSIDLGTGGLTSLGFNLVGNGPADMAMTVAGDRLYSTNQGDSTISGFAINGADGSLAATPNSPYAAGGGLFLNARIGVDRTGRFAFITSGATIYQKNILPTGEMIPTVPPTSVFSVGSVEVACHPTLDIAYESAPGVIHVLNIQPTGGLVDQAPPAVLPGFPAGETPRDVEITPNGNQLYAVTTIGNVYGWNLNGTGNGVLVGPPVVVGTAPIRLRIDPSSTFLYVTNSGSNTVSAFQIGAGGVLAPLAGSPFPMPGAGPQDISVAP